MIKHPKVVFKLPTKFEKVAFENHSILNITKPALAKRDSVCFGSGTDILHLL